MTKWERPRWITLKADGNKVKLVNEFGREWVIPDIRSETDAQHLVSEIEWLFECRRKSDEFNRLCRAGD